MHVPKHFHVHFKFFAAARGSCFNWTWIITLKKFGSKHALMLLEPVWYDSCCHKNKVEFSLWVSLLSWKQVLKSESCGGNNGYEAKGKKVQKLDASLSLFLLPYQLCQKLFGSIHSFLLIMLLSSPPVVTMKYEHFFYRLHSTCLLVISLNNFCLCWFPLNMLTWHLRTTSIAERTIISIAWWSHSHYPFIFVCFFNQRNRKMHGWERRGN